MLDQQKREIKMISKLALIVIPLVLFSCENYVENADLNSIFVNNDLDINYRINKDNNHKWEITVREDKSLNSRVLTIDIENKFSISSGEIPIIPNKSYELSLKLKNTSADPILAYSFWKKNQPLRHFIFNGENGNPPKAKTQEKSNEWIEYRESFRTKEGEDFLMIRMYCDEGIFQIAEFSIKEIL